jgi:hypothetical protein
MKLKPLKILFILCIVFFFAALLYFFMQSDKGEIKVITATSTIAAQQKVTPIRVASFTYATSSINLTVEYLEIVGFTSISENLKKEAQKLYDAELKELKGSINEFAPDREVIFEKKVQKDRVYIDTNSNTLSVMYTQYMDTGGAHGSFSYASDMIDTSTGKRLLLKDMLQGDYVAMITREIQRQIKLGNASDTCVNCHKELSEGGDVEVFIPESFLLSEKGITFLYSAYDLGAYAITSTGQEVTVSKEFLKSVVKRVW